MNHASIGALLALGALLARPAAAQVIPYDGTSPIQTATYVDVTDAATAVEWMPGAVIAQAVTYADATVGQARFSTAGVRFQTSANGEHGGEQMDLVSLTGLPDKLGGLGESGRFWIDETFGHADPADPASPFTLPFQLSYADAAVFVQNRSFMHWHPVSMTVDAVGSDSATLYMDEPAAYDGAHRSELMAYAAIAPGEYALDDGQVMLVGTVDIDETADADDFHTLDFGGRFLGEPAVIVRSQGTGRVDYQGVRVTKTFGADGHLDAVRFRPDFDGFDYTDSAGRFAYLLIGIPATGAVTVANDQCWDADAGLIAETETMRLYVVGGRMMLSRFSAAAGVWGAAWVSSGATVADTVCFQGDGNIVSYGGGAALAATGTHGQGHDALVLSEACGLYLDGGATPHMFEDLDCAEQIEQIEMGGYTFDFAAADVVDDGATVTATGEVSVSVGGFTIELSSSTLELQRVDGDWHVISGDINGLGGSLFEALEPFQSIAASGVRFEVGFATGDQIEDAPLAADDTFFYLELEVGSSMELGDFTLESSVGAAVRLYIDPTGPTVYIYGAGIFPPVGPVSLDEAGIGVSASDGLEWTPNTNWLNTGNITSRTGNVYVMGTLSVGAGQMASVSVTADALVDATFSELLTDEPWRAIDALAVNGTLSASLDLVIAGISFDLANASAVYEAGPGGGFGTLAASGEMQAPDIPGFGFVEFDGGARAAFWTDGSQGRLDIDGQMTLPGGVELDAFLHLDDRGGILDAEVDLGATSFSAVGTVNGQGQFALTSEGSFSTNTGVLKLTGTVEATVSNSGFDAEATAQGCVRYWHPPSLKFKWACDSVNASVDFTGSDVEVCANVSGTTLCADVDF